MASVFYIINYIEYLVAGVEKKIETPRYRRV